VGWYLYRGRAKRAHFGSKKPKKKRARSAFLKEPQARAARLQLMV